MESNQQNHQRRILKNIITSAYELEFSSAFTDNVDDITSIILQSITTE